MPETLGDYVKLIHEIDRAEFFETVPNYEANLQIEKTRMEDDNPSFASNPGLPVMVTNLHGQKKYGTKKGSPNQEV